MELPKELVDKFEDVKNRLLIRLRQTATQLHRYGGSMIEMYPETESQGGLYLMANGEFVTKESMMGYPLSATAEKFIHQYIFDHDKALVHRWEGEMRTWSDRLDVLGYHHYPLEEFEKDKNDPHNTEILRSTPAPTLDGIIEKSYTQEQLETALQEGIRIMEEALTKKPYTELGFGAFTPDQITIVDNPDKSETKPE